MLRLELLPAAYGDASLISYGPGAQALHHLLIDAGPASTVPSLIARLDRLGAEGGHIDLFVVTHIDNDHLGGALTLLRTSRIAEIIDAVWFNGYAHLARSDGLLGPVQGEQLTQQIVELGLPWNATWPRKVSSERGIGGPVVVSRPTKKRLLGGATALVLSPTAAKLRALLPVWERVVTEAGLRQGHPAQEPPEVLAPGLLGGSLSDLAAVRTTTDKAEANGSSIAFVFEYQGRRVLMGADAHPDALTSALGQLDERPYRVDACKLPHHGSRYNVSRDLVEALDCPLWLVSSNGARFRHPDDEALARVVRHGTRASRRPVIGWNYNSDRFAAFTAAFPPTRSGYEAFGPTSEGLVIDL